MGASCSTLPPANPPTDNPPVKEIHHSGRIIVGGLTAPDSKLTEDCDALSVARIQAGDIEAQVILAVAVEWAKTFHDCNAKYNQLKGWIQGVIDGQSMLQRELDRSVDPLGKEPDEVGEPS